MTHFAQVGRKGTSCQSFVAATAILRHHLKMKVSPKILHFHSRSWGSFIGDPPIARRIGRSGAVSRPSKRLELYR